MIWQNREVHRLSLVIIIFSCENCFYSTYCQVPVRGGSHDKLGMFACVCVVHVCLRYCVYVWELFGSVGRWVQQSSPSSGVCQWVTVKAEGREGRQYRVMRDVVNRLGHASVTAAATCQLHAAALCLHVTCQTWRGCWSGTRLTLIPADD